MLIIYAQVLFLWSSCSPNFVHLLPKQCCWVGYNTTNITIWGVSQQRRESQSCFLLVAFNGWKVELFKWCHFLIYILFVLLSIIQSNTFLLNYKQSPDFRGAINWSFNNSPDWRSKSECEHRDAPQTLMKVMNEHEQITLSLSWASSHTQSSLSTYIISEIHCCLCSWSMNNIKTLPWKTVSWHGHYYAIAWISYHFDFGD